MKYFWVYIVGIVIGISITYGMFVIKTQPSKPVVSPKISKPKEVNEDPYTIAVPPKESLKGLIATKSGTLLFESRAATQPAEMKNVSQAQQGERFITKNDGALTLSFENLGTIAFSENSDLSLIQTLPTNFVVEQKTGTISYKTLGNVPLSIRIRSAVISKASGGILQIEMTDGDPLVIVSPIDGDVKIGFNDLDYVSHTFTLRSGEVYEYDSDERTAINHKNK